MKAKFLAIGLLAAMPLVASCGSPSGTAVAAESNGPCDVDAAWSAIYDGEPPEGVDTKEFDEKQQAFVCEKGEGALESLADKEYGLRHPNPKRDPDDRPEATEEQINEELIGGGADKIGSGGLPESYGFEFNNVWQGGVNGKQAYVYVGQRVDDKSQGIIVTRMVVTNDGKRHAYEELKAPFPGPLEISSVEGTTVWITSRATQESVQLDVPTLTFK